MKKIIIAVVSIILSILLFFLCVIFLSNKSIKKANDFISKVEEVIAKEEIKNGVCTILEDGNLLCEDKTITMDKKVAKSGQIVIINKKISNVDIIVDDKNFINIDNELVLNNKKNKDIFVKGDSSGAEIPKLYTNKLIPVVYSNNNWIVANTDEEWYDYDAQEWANAVVLKPGIVKEVNDIIDINNEIQGMFVWIPRFEYKIENTYGTPTNEQDGTKEFPGIIDVNFISKNTSVAKKGYVIHPAFTFNNKELPGIWVSKFNTSTDKNSECYNADSNMSYDEVAQNYENIISKCNNEDLTPYVIPNARTLRFQNAHNQYITAMKMSLYLSNIDSHMSKNSEYTSVIYLSQSKYGKYGNENYTGNDKYIKKNNNSNYLTGCGSNDVLNSVSNECSEYVTSYGMDSSTTGNITGVYDMSSISASRVMGYLETDFEIETTNDFKSAGFINNPNSIYVNIFKLNKEIIDYDALNDDDAIAYMSKMCLNDSCLGHGLNEFYRFGEKEYVYTFKYPTIENPWIIRGDYNAFHFASDRGIAERNVTFRITLIDNQ